MKDVIGILRAWDVKKCLCKEIAFKLRPNGGVETARGLSEGGKSILDREQHRQSHKRGKDAGRHEKALFNEE